MGYSGTYSLSTCKCKITPIIYEHYIHEPKVKSQVLNNPSIIHILLVYFKLICDLNPMFTNHRHSPYHLCFGSVSCFCYFVILNPNSAGLMMNIVTLSHTGPIGGWGWIDQGLSPPPLSFSRTGDYDTQIYLDITKMRGAGDCCKVY